MQDVGGANIHGGRDVAFGEFRLNPGHGYADFLRYVDGKAAGVIEAGTGEKERNNIFAAGSFRQLPGLELLRSHQQAMRR